ncbi:MAG: NAD-dependent protein deacetylase [Ectothiorhodospiraceae bacterium]|nr:NAD-dependent protein deacetylase [Ectothiorhodospiraceae bacterium]
MAADADVAAQAVDALASFLARAGTVLALTGAGVSTDSGIPDYRDALGEWKRPEPVRIAEFLATEGARRRYWARSLVGWPIFRRARPGGAHRALAHLEALGRVGHLVTQNVDRLHQAAGHRDVTDLHGVLDTVVCLGCGSSRGRDWMQRALLAANPGWGDVAATPAPDGDADLGAVDLDRFRVPQCVGCGGVLKPDVVFFGENVPRERVARVHAALERAGGLLVVGSSLMVWSGYRFVRAAKAAGKPVAVLSLGRTRADTEVDLKLEASCAPVLERVATMAGPAPLSGQRAHPVRPPIG